MSASILDALHHGESFIFCHDQDSRLGAQWSIAVLGKCLLRNPGPQYQVLSPNIIGFYLSAYINPHSSLLFKQLMKLFKHPKPFTRIDRCLGQYDQILCCMLDHFSFNVLIWTPTELFNNWISCLLWLGIYSSGPILKLDEKLSVIFILISFMSTFQSAFKFLLLSTAIPLKE